MAKKAAKRAKKQTKSDSDQPVYAVKITLQGVEPLIWRRILVKDCTLDKLHEHIQTAMGWTNSHLHHFDINGQLYGDPALVAENFDELGYEDSTTTKLSDVLPASGTRCRFRYEYDFGDRWDHEILVEGSRPAEKGTRYPVCVEGERACPPEDVGGAHGYEEYLEALADPDHEEHESYLEWGGPFNPEKFSAAAATQRMRKGLPDWRNFV